MSGGATEGYSFTVPEHVFRDRRDAGRALAALLDP
jgi:hypothetical protein